MSAVQRQQQLEGQLSDAQSQLAAAQQQQQEAQGAAEQLRTQLAEASRARDESSGELTAARQQVWRHTLAMQKQTAASDRILVLGRSCTCTDVTLPQTQLSTLQMATIEQQLSQERQTVQRLDGTATQLQQEIDNQRNSLEEQGQCCF